MRGQCRRQLRCSKHVWSRRSDENNLRLVGGLALWQRRSSYERSCSSLSPVSTGMGDRLWAGIPPWYVMCNQANQVNSALHPSGLGSLNRVPALIGWGKGGNVTSAGWQVTLCDPMHVTSCSGVVLVAQTAIRFLTLPYLTLPSVNMVAQKSAQCFSTPQLYQLVTDFPNCFTVRIRRKLAIILSLNIPPHLR